MSIFSWFTDFFSSEPVSSSIADDISSGPGMDSFGENSLDAFAINPANGLLMVGGTGGLDVAGNPYGTDFSHDHLKSSGIDDSWSFSSTSSLFSSGTVSSSIADDISSSAKMDLFEANSLDEFAINPANGLPMVGGTGGVDIAGNPYGTDFSHDQLSSSGIDDSWSSSSTSSFDDTWSSGSSGGFSDW